MLCQGSTPERIADLRAKDDSGRLRVSPGVPADGNRPLLPFNTGGTILAPPRKGFTQFLLTTGLEVADGPPSPDQFVAGDVRANEQLGLTAAHTLFVRRAQPVTACPLLNLRCREHNRLVELLRPRIQNGEDRYQAARRIVAAELQVSRGPGHSQCGHYQSRLSHTSSSYPCCWDPTQYRPTLAFRPASVSADGHRVGNPNQHLCVCSLSDCGRVRGRCLQSRSHHALTSSAKDQWWSCDFCLSSRCLLQLCGGNQSHVLPPRPLTPEDVDQVRWRGRLSSWVSIRAITGTGAWYGGLCCS